MTTPQRIQRKRTKGWKMPENTLYVGRGSRWGNPFVVGKDGTAAECVAKYRDMLMPYTHHGEKPLEKFCISEANITDAQASLRGKNLACWCPILSGDEYCPCHADVLLSIANDLTMEEIKHENIRWAKGEAV